MKIDNDIIPNLVEILIFFKLFVLVYPTVTLTCPEVVYNFVVIIKILLHLQGNKICTLTYKIKKFCVYQRKCKNVNFKYCHK